MQIEEKQMDNWTEFLNKLTDDVFDGKLKGYLEAIKDISEISVDKIDLKENRERINEKLKYIVCFIEENAEEYYELGLIKGFKTSDLDGGGKIDGRDYYYYIADQKMKASVYYVRYRNFIDKHMNASEEEKQKLTDYISKIKGMTGTHMDISEDNIINVIDESIEITEENLKLRQQCVECIDRIRANDTQYLKYMLFNNMMREIRYIGAAYQYLWHWESKSKNLYRYVSYDGEEFRVNDNQTKKSFLQEMFSNVISHMNKSSKALCSYSEDPYIDIFKYLKIMKNEEKKGEEPLNISQNPDIHIYIANLENRNKAIFDFIKDAQINCIYRGGKSRSFYDFVQDGTELSCVDTVAYALELYPELPAQEKNSKDTAKNIKKLLIEYLKTWETDADVSQLMSYVADDKEVVSYGKIDNNVVSVEDDRIPGEVTSGTRYRMEFDKNELIYLLLKLNEKYTVEKTVKRISIDIDLKGIEPWIESVIKGENCESKSISGIITKQTAGIMSIRFNCKLLTSIVNDIEKPTLEKCKKKIKSAVETTIKGYFMNRYEAILKSEHKAADFVLTFIHKEHKCPQYISEYNEFEPDKGDPEISILKHIVFKEWNNAN